MTSQTPQLSILIASVNGSPMIEECLAALGAQQGDVDAEVIVVDVTGERTVKLIRDRFPWVRLVALDERKTIPELRARGLAESRGKLIVVLEDHCMVGAGWSQRIVDAHQRHPECVAVGGAVENGCRERLMDWAVFFSEYSAFMLPLSGGMADNVTGNNVSYKRRAFEGFDSLDTMLTQGFWETTLHGRLRERGERFVVDPSIVVFHKKRFELLYSLSQRFHYSRYYAGTLFSRRPLGVRLFRSGASLALPALLMSRIAVGVGRKGRHWRKLLLTMPLLAALTGVWAIGESVGALAGPGDSLRRIE